jgi:hypothetical protein
MQSKPRPKRQQAGSKRIHKSGMICQDGPLVGNVLMLESHSTLTMTIKGQEGRYVRGKWEPKCI